MYVILLLCCSVVASRLSYFNFIKVSDFNIARAIFAFCELHRNVCTYSGIVCGIRIKASETLRNFSWSLFTLHQH